MQTDLYVTVSNDRECLEFLEVLRRRGYRWPDGTAPDPDSLPPGDRRLPYALDTGRRTVARTSAAAVGYRLRQTGAPVRGFSELDPERL